MILPVKQLYQMEFNILIAGISTDIKVWIDYSYVTRIKFMLNHRISTFLILEWSMNQANWSENGCGFRTLVDLSPKSTQFQFLLSQIQIQNQDLQEIQTQDNINLIMFGVFDIFRCLNAIICEYPNEIYNYAVSHEKDFHFPDLIPNEQNYVRYITSITCDAIIKDNFTFSSW